MMKIGVVSDTHLAGNSKRLEVIFKWYFEDVDLILHAGDLVDLQVLNAFYSKDVKAVYGNMDPPSVRKVLPDRLIFDLDGFRVGLIHGWGAPFDLEGKLLQALGRADCLVYGHTHHAVNEKRDGVLFFNPGSAAEGRTGLARSIGIIDIDNNISGRILMLQDLP
jgi:hypothetical protein